MEPPEQVPMALLRRNVVANILGGACVAVLTIAITPLQINLLGIEAFGVIGFIATLQVVVGVLDFGLSSTITREIAGDQSPGRRTSRDLLRTAQTIYWGLAAVIGIGLFLISGYLAHRWFNPDTIDAATLQRAFQIAALYLALRWPISLYTGVLAGVQSMTALNLVKTGAVALRLLGGIVVLLVWRDLMAFLVWIGITSLLEVAAYALVARRATTDMDWRPGFSLAAVNRVWGFSAQMAALAILSMALTQLDRLMISKMLPLEQLGFYSLAYTGATAVSLLISSLSTALMPSLAQAHGTGARQSLMSRYDSATEVMFYATGLILFSLAFFGKPLLELWVNPNAAAGAWLPLALLAGGFWLGAAVSNAYTISIASQRPGGLLVVSAVTGILYVPLVYWMIVRWGIDGAAFSWLILNLVYVMTVIPWVHRQVLHIPVLPWFTRLLLPFALLGCATFGLIRVSLLWLPISGRWVELAGLAAAAILYATIGYHLMGAKFRTGMRESLRSVTARLGTS